MKLLAHTSTLVRWLRAPAVLATLLLTWPMHAHLTRAASTGVVISQIYGGGGNSGATYKNDFVELFNSGATAVSLTGWPVQYASATGTGNFGSATDSITPLSGSLAPGQYMLVQEASGSSCSSLPCGSSLPTPDVTDATPINMAAAK